MKKIIPQNSTVIIGVSGGPDSVFLLEQCLELTKGPSGNNLLHMEPKTTCPARRDERAYRGYVSEEQRSRAGCMRPSDVASYFRKDPKPHPFKIIVAHINHKLRGKESDQDAEFVQKLAKKNGLIYELKNLKKITKGNVEEVCRNARYDFFEFLRQKHHADWILTAHHQNDQIETILFNLTRGSFLNGLKGMQKMDEKRHLLRPLLNIQKNEILKWLKENKISYRLDKTNQQLDFSRNLLRHKIIPELKKINSNFEETFLKNVENIKDAAIFIDEHTENWLKKNFKNNSIKLANFLNLKPVIQKTILAQIYKKIYGNTNKFNQNHLKQILQILASNKSNRKKEFGDNYFITITKDADSGRSSGAKSGSKPRAKSNTRIIKFSPAPLSSSDKKSRFASNTKNK